MKEKKKKEEEEEEGQQREDGTGWREREKKERGTQEVDHTHTHTSGERDRGGPSSYCNAEVSILPGCIIVQSATAAARCFRDHAPDHGIEQYITSSSRHPSNFRVLFREFENRVGFGRRG